MHVTLRKSAKLNTRSYVDPSIVIPITTVMVSAAVAGMLSCYHISDANQYIVKTGLGIKDISVGKKAFVLPFVQTGRVVNMNPINYEFTLHAMSIEKIPFILPGFFSIGPKDDPECIIKYVRFIEKADINNIILGIIEGETRTLSSRMTMEEIFNDRQKFKEIIIKGVQEELDQFGLMIFNANIKELMDSGESKYFHNMMQQKASTVENQAKVAVAEANKLGNIGHKEREAMTRQRVANLESDTIKTENEATQQVQISNRELSVVIAENDQKSRIAQIESISNASIREYELQQTIEQERLKSETIKSKASILPQVIVEVDALKMKADAALYAKQQEAEGIKAVYFAQSNGINNLLSSFNNDANTMMQFMMIENHLYEKIAEENAKAFQGLKPKITMISTGKDDNPVGDIFKMGLPIALGYLNNQLTKQGQNKE